MDYNTFTQFARELSNDLQTMMSFVPDYTGSLDSIQGDLSTIALHIGTLVEMVQKAAETTLETATSHVLQKENAALVAALTDKDLQLAQMRTLLQDLAEPCVGCKKLSWTPHKPDCAWFSVNDKLREALNVKDNREAEESS